MTVAEETPYRSYTANGTTNNFPIVFDYRAASSLVVRLNGVATNAYSIVSGSVVLASTPPLNTFIEILRKTPLARQINYNSFNSTFKPTTLNTDFDALWLAMQEQKQSINFEEQARMLADIDYQDLAIGRENALKQYIDDVATTVLNEQVGSGVSFNQKAVTTVLNVAELKALASSWDGRTVQTLGYYTEGDGGSGVYTYDIASTVLADEIYVVAPQNNAGRWIASEALGDTLKEKQNKFYSKALNKLKNKQPLTLVCQGTSITEGHDTTSADRRQITINSGVNVASITYPEELKVTLDRVYNSNHVTVINRGVSGQTVEQSFNTWRDANVGDITILEFGGNEFNTNVDLGVFYKNYKRLITHLILKGSACVILTSNKLADANNFTRDAYSNVGKLLAKEFDIPVVDLDLVMKNYSRTVYSDGVHLNGTGYRIIARKAAAAFFIGEGAHSATEVGTGSTLLSRSTIDNIVYGALSEKSNTQTTGQTPDEVLSTGSGIVSSIYGSQGEAWVTYSFYCKEDNLVCIPTALLRNSSEITISLDGGYAYPQDSIDAALNEPATRELGLSTVVYQNTTGLDSINSKHSLEIAINCVTAGWHTLEVKAKAADVFLYGLEFVNEQVFKTAVKTNIYSQPIGIDNISQVTTTSIRLSKLLDRFNAVFYGIDYWKNPSLRLLLTMPLHCIDEYRLVIGDQINGVAFRATPVTRYVPNGVTLNPAQVRTLTSVSYNPSTDIITFTWGGDTARRGNLTILI